ncbi:hypothetical protein G9A89_015032 [Geosiphon pyriformis]|nr:hypothetical protein G9A89_015032 [Geosiphon pyriformis]
MIEPVGSSAGGPSSGLVGLRTHLAAKNKCVNTVYSHGTFYKKLKIPVISVVLDSSTDPLSLEDIRGAGNKPLVSWRSDVSSVASSVGNLSDVKNIINMVAKETSFAESGEDDNMNDTMPRKTRTYTYVLDSPLKQPSFGHMNDDDCALELSPCMFSEFNQLLLPKSHALENCYFESVKLFALDVNLSAVPEKSVMDGFGEASVSSKFPEIIRSSFTSEFSLNKAKKMAINEKILVNDDLKKANIHTNWEVIIKKIPVDLPKSAIVAVFSKFGAIKSVRMQLIGLWQKALVEFESVEVANQVASKWSVLVEKDSVCVALAVEDKQMWVLRNQHQALLYTLPVDTIAYNLSGLLESYGGKTYFIGCNPSLYVRDQCAVICFENEAFKLAAVGLIPVFKDVNLHWAGLCLAYCMQCTQFGYITANCSVMVSNQNRVCLAVIYKKKSAPVLMVGAPSGVSSHRQIPSFGSIDNGKPLLSVMNDLEKQLVSIESSLISFARQIVTSLLQNQEEDIVMGVSLGKSTCDKTVAATATATYTAKDSSVSSHVVKLENMLEGLAVLVLSLSAHFDSLALAAVEGKNLPWIADRFAGVRVFTSGLDSSHMEFGVAIIMNSSLVKHVCKVLEVLSWLLLVKLLFRKRLSVSILGLYAGASLTADEINFLIAKAVNESSFIILSGNFNKNSSHKCASFRKCFNLELVNSLGGSSLAKLPTWCNFHGVVKTIDYVFLSSNLVNVIMNYGMLNVDDFFDTDHKVVSVSFDVKNTNELKWAEFRDGTAANAFMFLDAFVDIIRKIIILLAGGTFKKKWFKGFNSVFNKVFSRFHKLEWLVSKLVKAFCLIYEGDFALLLDTWNRLNSVGTSLVKSLFLLESGFNDIRSELAKARKSYCSSKMLESKCAKESCIRQTIENRIKSFELNKSHTIRSVLEYSFCKVVLDHLVVNNELVLEPELVKSKTRRQLVVLDFSDDWKCQFWPLDYVFDGAFSGVMNLISFDEMFSVISSLPNGKAAGFSEGVLINTHSIVLIETACKILSKILSDRISSACNEFNLPIFVIGSVVEDALEKNRKLWLVLQNMHKGYDLVVITNFGLTSGYVVHDSLDQGEVFSLLLWHIFYDSLMCKVKRQGEVYGYRLNSHFAGLTLFFATSAFVDDTIWVASSQATTQHILDVASEFFRINDISINNDKTMAISINCWVETPYLTVSDLPIFIAKKGEPYCYLGIFLSSNGLLVPSLAKTHSNVRFFVNLVLKKAISDKQFSYLASAAESKLASIIAFANSVGILGHLFSHRSHNLQILSWRLCHPLLFPACVSVNSSNNFLAGVVCIFSGCDLSLGGSLTCAFYCQGGTLMSLILGEINFLKCVSSLKQYGITFIFKHWKRLNPHGPIPFWFDLSMCFFSGVASSPVCSSLVKNSTLSLNGLGTVAMKAEAVVFFEDINSGLGVGVSGLVSFTLSELQAIALALECVLSSHVVDLFSDSQVVLDACKSESLLACPDFRNYCWIECCHIANVIHRKNLTVNWIKIKGHLGISGNKRADELAKNAALSTWHLPHLVSKHFLRAGGNKVSGNSRHFVHDVFWSILHTRWEVGSGFWVLVAGLHNGVDWSKSFLVWHPDSHLAAGFTSARTVGLQTYFMKSSHHQLSVTVRKHLYNRCYPSVVCLFCGDVKFSDHETRSGLSQSTSCVLQLLASCFSDATISTTLYKGFVFDDWYCEFFSVFKDAKVVALNIVCFVHENRLIPHDGSIPVLVSGLSTVLSASVIRLLGVIKAFGIGFGFHKPCLFFSGIRDFVSVKIDA